MQVSHLTLIPLGLDLPRELSWQISTTAIEHSFSFSQPSVRLLLPSEHHHFWSGANHRHPTLASAVSPGPPRLSLSNGALLSHDLYHPNLLEVTNNALSGLKASPSHFRRG